MTNILSESRGVAPRFSLGTAAFKSGSAIGAAEPANDPAVWVGLGTPLPVEPKASPALLAMSRVEE